MSLRDLAAETLRRCDGEGLARAAAATLDRRARRVFLAGAGKASGHMGRGVADALGGALGAGLLIAKDGAFDGFAPASVEVRFAGHPSPDARSAEAGRLLWDFLGQRRVDELVVFVLSGGASSLLATPAPGLSFEALRQTSDALLAAGLRIDDINRVRKQLTLASGGRLARRCVARVEVLVLSDVVSGDLCQVGSGPFLPADATPAAALELLRGLEGVPRAVLEWLRQPPIEAQVPAADDPIFARVRHRVLASVATLLERASGAARESGRFTAVLELPPSTDDVEAVATRLVGAAAGLAPGGLVVGGGEPSVRLPAGAGRGGRSQQLALTVAKRIAGKPLSFLALGSDGSDGPTDAAGAEVDGATWSRLAACGDPERALAAADAYPLLAAAGCLVRTGPTGTNLCDLHLLSVTAASAPTRGA